MLASGLRPPRPAVISSSSAKKKAPKEKKKKKRMIFFFRPKEVMHFLCNLPGCTNGMNCFKLTASSVHIT